MTPELGPEARALLDAARQGLGPDAAAVRRMRANIGAAVAGGAAATGTASALTVKVGIVAVVAALAIGAVIYLQRDEPEEFTPAAPIAEVAPPPAAPPPVAAPPVAREPVAAPPTAEVAIEILPDPPVEAAPARRRPARAAVTPPPPAAPAPQRADLAREVALVDHAMAALRRGDPNAALSAVRTHTTETAGAGQLAEDAAAIEIEALCRLRADTVAAKLAAFDAKWPASAQRARLTARCR